MRKIIPILFLSAVVSLTACNKTVMEEQKIPALNDTPVVEPVDLMEEDMMEAETVVEEDAEEPELPGAEFYGADYTCNSLKDTENRENCEVQVIDLIGSLLRSEIMGSYDVKRCNELPEALVGPCEERLTSTGVQGPVSAEEMAIFDEAMRGTTLDTEDGEGDEDVIPLLGTTTYDKAKCAELKTSGYKAYCEGQIDQRMDSELMDAVMQSGDLARCDEIDTESFRVMCQLALGAELFEPIPEEAEPTEEAM